MEERFETFTVLINRINRNIRRIKNHEMAEYNLRSSHISCLYYLFLEKELTATELCERCEEDKATVSRSLDYLEKQGFLTCRPTDTKRYKTPLLLTPKGEEAGKKISQKINGVLEQVGLVLSEEERIAFYHSLAKISQKLDTIGNE